MLLGRSRVSEDVDFLVQSVSFEEFIHFHVDMKKKGFYCLNAESAGDVHSYLRESLAVRFARVGTVIPNIIIKFVKNDVDFMTLRNRATVFLGGQRELYISPLEMRIAYKEVMLGSPKDVEDALHLRKIADVFIQDEEIGNYKVMLRERR